MTGPLSDVVTGVERLPREIIDAAVERFDEIATESAALVVGAGGTMNIRNKRGGVRAVPLRTKPQITGRNSITIAIVRGKPVGLWVWIEDGTKAHDIAPPKVRGRGKRRALGRPGSPDMKHPVYGPVHHKGTSGSQAWTRAVGDMEFEIDGLIEAEVRELIRG